MAGLTPITTARVSTATLDVHIDGALRTLATSADPVEIVKIHGIAEAIRHAAKQSKLGLEAQNRAAELRLRAKRRLGDLLRDRLTRGRPRSGENVEPNYHYSSVDPGSPSGIYRHYPARRPRD